MKLLNTTASNTKIKKTQNKPNNYFAKPIRMASLSMLPDNIICAGSKAAGCMNACLKDAGRAQYNPQINIARQKKTDYWHADQAGFLAQLTRELSNFQKNVCERQNVQGVVRLNTISDIPWEEHGIPQEFPDLFFYDYTKQAKRLGNTPDNYRLMFSYSARHQYRKQVLMAVCQDNPIAVVFKSKMPDIFLGRKVFDGDVSDLDNVLLGPVVVGLKAKGPAKNDTGGFVVDTNVIPTFAVA